MTRNRVVRIVTIVAVAVVLLAAAAVVGHDKMLGKQKISAVFTTATAIYPGDEVRVSGVKVGKITSIDAQGTSAMVGLEIDRKVPIPADAKAVIVAQSLIAARYVQLTPAYHTSGPKMPDGTVIPIERTAVPVEWDEVKDQLNRLSADLGPNGDQGSSATGRFVDSAANAMAGNGDKLRQTLAQLSSVGRILAGGSSNIVDIIKNLQIFVSTLRDSNQQIVQFEGRLATLSSVLDDNKSDLDAALKSLTVAIGEVQRFVAENRDKAGEQVQRLADVTQNLVDHRDDLEQVLHVAPTAYSNFYNMYNPEAGTAAGVPVINNFSNPVQFICGAVASLQNTTSAEGAKKCADYLGPVAPMLMLNYFPVPINPVLAPNPPPNEIVYSEPDLVPQVVAPQAPPPAPAAVADLLLPVARPPS